MALSLHVWKVCDDPWGSFNDRELKELWKMQDQATEPLVRLIEALNGQNKILSRARLNYLNKESERKHFEATEVLSSQGKSQAEKVTLAQSTNKWLEFHRELAKLESLYQFELFKFKILELNFQSEYLSAKQEGREIERAGKDPRY